MNQSNQCDCLLKQKRPCEACWQKAFDKLREEARAEDAANGDLGRVIEPSPEGREGKASLDDVLAAISGHKKRRRVGGFHTKDGSAKAYQGLVDDEHRPRHLGRFNPKGGVDTGMIRDKLHEGRSLFATEIPDHPANCDWVCPKCGPLQRKYPPMLADEDDHYHCSSLDCDEIVFKVADLLASKAKDDAAQAAASLAPILNGDEQVDETAAEDRPEDGPSPEDMGFVTVADDAPPESTPMPTSGTDDAAEPAA